MKDKDGQKLHIGDIISEDIYTVFGKKVGEIICVIKKIKKEIIKEVIADNGGIGFILKGQRAKLLRSDLEKIKRIGYNYEAKAIEEKLAGER